MYIYIYIYVDGQLPEDAALAQLHAPVTRLLDHTCLIRSNVYLYIVYSIYILFIVMVTVVVVLEVAVAHVIIRLNDHTHTFIYN